MSAISSVRDTWEFIKKAGYDFHLVNQWADEVRDLIVDWSKKPSTSQLQAIVTDVEVAPNGSIKMKVFGWDLRMVFSAVSDESEQIVGRVSVIHEVQNESTPIYMVYIDDGAFVTDVGTFALGHSQNVAEILLALVAKATASSSLMRAEVAKPASSTFF